MGTRIFHADHVLPGNERPLVDGAVVVDDDGTVRDLGKASEVLIRHAGAEITRIRGALLPGLVNAHAHLELSALHGQVPGGRGFLPWVDGLIALRHELQAEEEAPAISRAVDEIARFGTVAVGEVTNTLAAVDALAERGIGGCIFHEVFGQDRVAVLQRVSGLRQELAERVPVWPTNDLSYAPAPHTLHTTHEDAVRLLLELARSTETVTSLHLAEHAAERLAIECGGGSLPDWFFARVRQRPAWPKVPLFDYADRVGALSSSVLLVHLVDARVDELARVAKVFAPVVLCPRSNLHIERRLPPLESVREAGIEAALGTDSLASNGSLDVLAEASVLHEHFPATPAWELVQMATWNGARALGRRDLGRFSKGARPGVLAVDLPEGGIVDAAAFLLTHLELPRRMVARRAPEARL